MVTTEWKRHQKPGYYLQSSRLGCAHPFSRPITVLQAQQLPGCCQTRPTPLPQGFFTPSPSARRLFWIPTHLGLSSQRPPSILLHLPPSDGSSSSLPLSSSSLLLFFSKGYSHDVAVYSVSLVGTIRKPRPRTTAPPTSRTVPGPSDPKVPHQQQNCKKWNVRAHRWTGRKMYLPLIWTHCCRHNDPMGQLA